MKDKVKRLISKYEKLNRNNEEFQRVVLKELEDLNTDLIIKGKSSNEGSTNKSQNNVDKFVQMFKILKEVIADR